MTVYLSAGAARELSTAQTRLDEHPLGLDYRCRRCGTIGDCPQRVAALAVFARYRRLPTRRPGSSLPSPQPVCPAAPPRWFAASSGRHAAR